YRDVDAAHPRIVHADVGDEVAARVDHGHIARRPDLARLGLTGSDHALCVFERYGYLADGHDVFLGLIAWIIFDRRFAAAASPSHRCAQWRREARAVLRLQLPLLLVRSWRREQMRQDRRPSRTVGCGAAVGVIAMRQGTDRNQIVPAAPHRPFEGFADAVFPFALSLLSSRPAAR